MTDGFHYSRRVHFYETDLAGVVHFSCYFRYMEEAEHALWRAAGMSIDSAGAEVGWPRVSTTFEYQSPLRFEDQFEIVVRVKAATKQTLEYGFTFARGATAIGAGTLTVACASRSNGRMRGIAVPEDVVARLRAAAGQTS
jgi:YbgC/YbaW family acyl-CoA thioester hydrolase